jgi:hypothetical protein
MPQPYSGPELAKLRKYRLANEDGTLRETEVPGLSPPVGPVMSEEVIDKFLELDPSKRRNVFDWMLFASGGGQPAMEVSERAIDQAKKYVVGRRMKGFGREDEKIEPMTAEQAEADWAQDEPAYRDAYVYADEDLARDPQYPIFGYFRKWPGRNGVYKKVYDAVKGFQEIVGNKELLRHYNQLFPSAPFQTVLTQYNTADDLLRVVSQFRRKIAQRRAEKDIRYVDPEGTVGPDKVIYQDDAVKVLAPATAAAAMGSGAPNWCISNKTRWQTYFDSGSQSDLFWGSYCERGPFVFFLFKKGLKDSDLQKLAAHMLGATPESIQFWDVDNRQAFSYDAIITRMDQEDTEVREGFVTGVNAAMRWLSNYKPHQVERYPSLEAIRQAARQLATAVLAG